MKLKATRHASIAAVLALVVMDAVGPSAQQPASPSAQTGTAPSTSPDLNLQPTNHPRLPPTISELWMVPAVASPRTGALGEFATAVKLEVDGAFGRALPILSKPLLADQPLGDYAEYYRGLAQLRLGRPTEALKTFQALAASKPIGYLNEAVALSEAEADEAMGDSRSAVTIYERLSNTKTTAPDDVLLRLGRAAQASGDNVKAFGTYSRLYFEFPLSDVAGAAGAELDRWVNREPISAGGARYKLELGRAERLFGAKRYTPARVAFEALRVSAQGDDRELIDLRLAECDYFLKRPRNARDSLRPYTEKASRQGEALFFYALAQKELGARADYLANIRRIVEQFPTETWAEEALNNLATDYIVQNDDDASADATFREMYAKFPAGRYADRAAWKVGWLAYRNGKYADTVRYFESAAVQFPRSDYRPTWLYWAARAHEALNETELARARYTLTATDYLNSYYGRLAVTHLEAAPKRRLISATAELQNPQNPAGEVSDTPQAGPSDGTAEPSTAPAPPLAPLPPNERIIRALLGLGLYDQAIDELHYAQKTWGDSSAILATLAWISEQQGRLETGERQFSLFRSAINTMKRAYPQYMASGGEALPKPLLKVIFPIGYWDLIRKYASERELDPYLVAALVAQESTFVASIHSYAKAVGLMQLEPPTAREYARKLNIKYSSRLLTNPDSNIKIGTAMLADQIRLLGNLHLVLASYNAGIGNVRRWVADRAGLARDEFIDDIPFPQTQLYVKKILGTAEDYRRLYGTDAATTANR